MMETNIIIHGNCLEYLNKIPKPDLIVSDPPYEFVNKGGGLYSMERTKRIMDKIDEIGTNTFEFDKYIPKILDLQQDKVNAYFFCNKTLLPNYLNLAIERGLSFDILVLRKLNPVPAFNNGYMNELEYIVFLRSKGVYFSSKEGYENYKKCYDKVLGHLPHPNQKPLEQIQKFIKVSSRPNDLIFDPFIGSGTTAMACLELNRKFIGIELSETYVRMSNERIKGRKEQTRLNQYE